MADSAKRDNGRLARFARGAKAFVNNGAAIDCIATVLRTAIQSKCRRSTAERRASRIVPPPRVPGALGPELDICDAACWFLISCYSTGSVSTFAMGRSWVAAVQTALLSYETTAIVKEKASSKSSRPMIAPCKAVSSDFAGSSSLPRITRPRRNPTSVASHSKLKGTMTSRISLYRYRSSPLGDSKGPVPVLRLLRTGNAVVHPVENRHLDNELGEGFSTNGSLAPY